MAAYTIVFYTLLLMNGGFCKLVKINLVLFKDTAFISSKCHFDRCKHCWVISVPKMQSDRQTDRQTDSFSALYSRYPSASLWILNHEYIFREKFVNLQKFQLSKFLGAWKHCLPSCCMKTTAITGVLKQIQESTLPRAVRVSWHISSCCIFHTAFVALL